jgi:hypothetical protein
LMQVVNFNKNDTSHILKTRNETFDAGIQCHQNQFGAINLVSNL